MYMFGEKLASIAVADQLFCIGHDRWLVETCSESLSDQGPRGGMIAASTTVNFMEQVNTCFSSDTLHQNCLLCIFAHQDTIDQ
jgi:hypothetical protein